MNPLYASDFRQTAREKLAGNWWISIAAALVASILGGLVTGESLSLTVDLDALEGTAIYTYVVQHLLPLITMLASVSSTLGFAQFILGGVVGLGYCTYLLDQHDGRELSVKTLFSKFDYFLDGFVLNLLTGLYTVLWSLLFVIPGIVASYRYAMSSFIMTENPGMTAKEAIEASKAMMDGHKWELFCLDFSFIGWHLLCTLTFGLGNLALNPYRNASHAAFYRRLCRANAVEQPVLEEASF